MNPPLLKDIGTQSYVNFTKIASSGTKQTSSGHTFDQIFNTCTINAYPPPSSSNHHWGNSIPNRRHFVGEDDGEPNKFDLKSALESTYHNTSNSISCCRLVGWEKRFPPIFREQQQIGKQIHSPTHHLSRMARYKILKNMLSNTL